MAGDGTPDSGISPDPDQSCRGHFLSPNILRTYTNSGRRGAGPNSRLCAQVRRPSVVGYAPATAHSGMQSTYPKTLGRAGLGTRSGTLILAATLLVLALLLGANAFRAPSQPSIILATTTSTQDSGLLDVLVPRFERE